MARLAISGLDLDWDFGYKEALYISSNKRRRYISYEFLCFSHLPGCDKPSGEPALRLFALPVGSFRLLLHKTNSISMLTNQDGTELYNQLPLIISYLLDECTSCITFPKIAGLCSPIQN